MKDEEDTKQPFDLRERTKAFALRMIRMFVALPKTEEARVIGRQVLRSGTSVGANYREAHRSRSKAERGERGEGSVRAYVQKSVDCWRRWR